MSSEVSEKTQEIIENKESEEKMIKCVECGKEFKESELTLNAYGEYVCEECLQDKYFECEDCNKFFKLEECTELHSGRLVCEECLDNYEKCEDCGEYFDRYDMYYVSSSGGYYICDDCRYNGYYYTCSDCGELYYQDDLSYNEYDDCDYCSDCWGNHVNDERILGWHDHKGDYLSFHKCESEDEPRYYIGIETETIPNCGRDNESEFLDTLDSKFLPCYYERDSSLGDNGVEVITEPCSPDYIYSRYNDIKSAFDKGIELGYRSDTEHSAVHIHVSRPENEEVIDRVWFILEAFKEQVIQVARRHSSSYAEFISDTIYNVDNEYRQSLKFIKDNKSGKGRYMALNLTNDSTIEFRIFKGTLNSRTWVAYVQFIDNIMQVAYDLDKKLEDIVWEDLIKGEYISDYVKERGIVCDIKVVDNTDKLELIKEENDKVVKQVLDLLYNRWLYSVLLHVKYNFELSGDITNMYAQAVHQRYDINDWLSMYDMVNRIDTNYKNTCNIISFKDSVKDICDTNMFRSDSWKIKENILKEILDIIQ